MQTTRCNSTVSTKQREVGAKQRKVGPDADIGLLHPDLFLNRTKAPIRLHQEWVASV